jgi:hypothetical protein
MVSDNKSGSFHYSGNIPWPGNGSHVMGYATAILNANNTARHIYQSGTDNSQGIHDHNGQYFGLPDSDGSGWLGANTGYSASDSRTRIHGLDFRNPESPSVSVYNPGATTSTSPVMQFLLQANSTTANTAISGVTHWYQSGSQCYARVFSGSSTSYNDVNAGAGGWDNPLSSSQFWGVALSTGAVLVYHGAKTYLYNSYTSYSDVTSTAGTSVGFGSDPNFGGACIVPDGANSWLIVHPSASFLTISKWSINTSTYAWTKSWSKMVGFGGGSYMKLNLLPNSRIMLSIRTNPYADFYYWIINRTDLPA